MFSKKGLFAIILIIAAITVGYGNMKKVTPGSAVNNGNTGEFDEGDGRRFDFDSALKNAGVSSSQEKKINELREKGDWGGMRTAMNDILTSDQRAKLRQGFEAQRAQGQQQRAARETRLRASLSKTEYDRYQEKRQSRRGGGRGRPQGDRGRGGSANSPGKGA